MLGLTFLLIFPALAQCRLSITSSTPSGTIMPSGEGFTLSCTTNLPWFLCIWEGPGGLACQCQTQEGGVSQMCLGDSRIHLSGGSTTCFMTISGVLVDDMGQYRCVLADRDDIVTVARTITDVGVGVEAVVSWGEDTTGSLTAGTEAQFTCLAEGGYPEPEIEISGPDNIRIGRPDSSQSQNSPGIDVIQAITYEGRDEDNGDFITCTSTQHNRLGEVLYTSSVDMRLDVTPVIIDSLAIPIGGIIGIILASLLILGLCIGCLIFFLCCPMGIAYWDKKGPRPEPFEGSDTSLSSESEYDAKHEGSLQNIQVVSETTQHQGYVAEEANIERDNKDASSGHVIADMEYLLKTSHEDTTSPDDEHFENVDENSDLIIGSGEVKKTKRKKDKNKSYYPGKYEQEYKEMNKEHESSVLLTNKIVTTTNNQRRIINNNHMQRITEENITGEINGYEAGHSSEESEKLIISDARENKQNNIILNEDLKTAGTREEYFSKQNGKITQTTNKKIQTKNQDLLSKVTQTSDNKQNKNMTTQTSQDSRKYNDSSSCDDVLSEHSIIIEENNVLPAMRIQNTNNYKSTDITSMTNTNIQTHTYDLSKKETHRFENKSKGNSMIKQTSKDKRRFTDSSSNEDVLSEHSINIEQNNVLPAIRIQNNFEFQNNESEVGVGSSFPLHKKEDQLQEKGYLKKQLSNSSSTSYSSMSEYDACHETKVKDFKLKENSFKNTDVVVDNYTMNQYRMNDCESIDMRGLTYTEVIEEHLSRSPSMQTSKSSIELEKKRNEARTQSEGNSTNMSVSSPSPPFSDNEEKTNMKSGVNQTNTVTEQRIKIENSTVIDETLQNRLNQENIEHTELNTNHKEVIERHLARGSSSSNSDTMTNTFYNQTHKEESSNDCTSKVYNENSLYTTHGVNHLKVTEHHLQNISSYTSSEQKTDQTLNNQRKTENFNHENFPPPPPPIAGNYEEFKNNFSQHIKSNSVLTNIETNKNLKSNLANESGSLLNNHKTINTSTPRESIRQTKVQNSDAKYKYIQNYLTDKEYFQMLREKQDFLNINSCQEIKGKSEDYSQQNGGKKSNVATSQEKNESYETKHGFKGTTERELDESQAKSRKYIITQQEIVFYLKNADGVVRIIHRPLMSKRMQSNHYERHNETECLRERRSSQPDLRHPQMIKKVEGNNHFQIKAGESRRVKHLRNEEEHIANVGVLHRSGCLYGNQGIQLKPLESGWRSSGSIFDCEQGCFTDQTLLI